MHPEALVADVGGNQPRRMGMAGPRSAWQAVEVLLERECLVADAEAPRDIAWEVPATQVLRKGVFC